MLPKGAVDTAVSESDEFRRLASSLESTPFIYVSNGQVKCTLIGVDMKMIDIDIGYFLNSDLVVRTLKESADGYSDAQKMKYCLGKTGAKLVDPSPFHPVTKKDEIYTKLVISTGTESVEDKVQELTRQMLEIRCKYVKGYIVTKNKGPYSCDDEKTYNILYKKKWNLEQTLKNKPESKSVSTSNETVHELPLKDLLQLREVVSKTLDHLRQGNDKLTDEYYDYLTQWYLLLRDKKLTDVESRVYTELKNVVYNITPTTPSKINPNISYTVLVNHVNYDIEKKVVEDKRTKSKMKRAEKKNYTLELNSDGNAAWVPKNLPVQVIAPMEQNPVQDIFPRSLEQYREQLNILASRPVPEDFDETMNIMSKDELSVIPSLCETVMITGISCKGLAETVKLKQMFHKYIDNPNLSYIDTNALSDILRAFDTAGLQINEQ